MKKIGIVGWVDSHMFGVNKMYLRFIERYGKPVIITPQESGNVEEIDLLILPGGPDIPYYTYDDDKPDYLLSKQCPFRDHFENVSLLDYIDAKIPIFGICRGFQSIATLLNADFTPHISMHHPRNSQSARGAQVHYLTLTKSGMNFIYENSDDLRDAHQTYSNAINNRKDLSESEIKEIESTFRKNFTSKLSVNSLHHQGVLPIENGDMNILATSGLNHRYAEAIMSANGLMAGVQYHPEELEDDVLSDLIITKLLNK